jgi:hypothetical protein
MVNTIQKGASLCYCRSKPIDALGENIDGIIYWPDQIDSKQWKTSFTMPSQDFCERFLVNANVIPNASAVVFLREISLNCLPIASMLGSYLFMGDWVFWMHYLTLANKSVSYSNIDDSWFRHHAFTTRTSSVSRERHVRHVEEYCKTVTYFSKQTLLKNQFKWHIRAFSKDWDWIHIDYMHRLKPSFFQILAADGLNGLLANLLFIRLLLSKELRTHSFPKLHRRKKRYIERWKTLQAKLAQALKQQFLEQS